MNKWLMLVYGEGEPSDFPLGSKKYIRCVLSESGVEGLNKDIILEITSRLAERMVREVKGA